MEANRELQLIQANLEQIIQSRTQDLQNRSKYLQATIEVSRVASGLLDDDTLMNQAVDRIQSQFGLYYVGLFLLDFIPRMGCPSFRNW